MKYGGSLYSYSFMKDRDLFHFFLSPWGRDMCISIINRRCGERPLVKGLGTLVSFIHALTLQGSVLNS